MRIPALLLVVLGIELGGAVNAAPLELEAKIPLGEVRGRIDHLAVDVERQRLYVAELGNDSVGVVDLKERKVVRTLAGLKEPQGIGYVRSTDTVYVANAGDGSVRMFQGANLTPAGKIDFGSDADNVRIDDAAGRIFVGYGDGALAVIDAASRRKLSDIPLQAHPESFQLDSSGQRIYVNVPDARQIAFVDRSANRQIAPWSTGGLRANFPLALDEPHGRLLAIFRHPARLGEFDLQDGRLLSTANTCEDADDAFIDAKRNRVYVSCGEGFLDVLALQGSGYVSIGRVRTAPGARTALYVSTMDRLMLAVRATGDIPASVWVFRPTSE